MVEAPSVGSLAAALPGASRSQRAGTWLRLADVLAGAGRREEALLAARTSLALGDGTGDAAAERGTADEATAATEAARAAVRSLTGPDVVPLHVAMGAEGGRGGGTELRAVWLGAPADPVLAMLGWVERDGTVDVVRVVVPGTRRGRSAFGVLLRSLPGFVPVRLRLPARDAALVRLCVRAGFHSDRVGEDAGGHVGGTVHLLREPEEAAGPTGPTGPGAVVAGA